MRVELFFEQIKRLGIDTFAGVPDSLLKPFCSYLQSEEKLGGHVFPNEGTAVGYGIGAYLATGKPPCIYMQNSGLGNIVNPVTSLLNQAVYAIPMIFVIGWRGRPGEPDEPQHRFMGCITAEMCSMLQMDHTVLTKETTEKELLESFERAGNSLRRNCQYAFLVEACALEGNSDIYHNEFQIIREEAIAEIVRMLAPEDIVIATTGKISRELYEQSERIWGQHAQDFLTVGGMGHASMIALGIAEKRRDRRIFCLDGDGAVLMHMGALAAIGKRRPENLFHICLNNNAHDSVGGMPTAAGSLLYAGIAEACGYEKVIEVGKSEALKEALELLPHLKGPVFIEITTALYSRKELGRPKETAVENKLSFMKYHRSEI